MQGGRQGCREEGRGAGRDNDDGMEDEFGIGKQGGEEQSIFSPLYVSVFTTTPNTLQKRLLRITRGGQASIRHVCVHNVSSQVPETIRPTPLKTNLSKTRWLNNRVFNWLSSV